MKKLMTLFFCTIVLSLVIPVRFMVRAENKKIEVTDVVENIYFPQAYAARENGIVFSGNSNYHGYQAGIFTVGGETAFCMQHEKWNPPTGTAYTDTPYINENIRRVLYYGMNGTEPWPGFENDIHARVLTSFALSYYYYGDVSASDSSYSYLFNQGGLRAFLNYCESKQIPAAALTVSKSSVKAHLNNDRTMQITDTVTLNGDSRNSVTFTLPVGVTLHNTTTGKASTGTVTVKGGNGFYLSAPLTVTGNWSTGSLKGSMKNFCPILSMPNGNYQALGRGSWQSPESAGGLSVKWLDMGQVRVTKQDSETNQSKPQGKGAEFTGVNYLVKDGNGVLVDTITLKDGMGVSKQIPLGSYTVQEDASSAPEGYLADETVYQVTLPSTETNPLMASVTSKEDIIRGDFSLIKFGESGPGEDEEEIKRPLKDVEFTITSKTDRKEIKIVTDKDGYATTKSPDYPRGRLTYGEYHVEESKTPRGHSAVKPFDIVVNEEGQIVRYILENKLILSALRIEKIDAETKKIIPIAGTKFRILDGTGVPVKMTVHYPQTKRMEVFQTDKSGSVVLPEKLKTGHYQIEEILAPSGYLKGENIHFEVKENMDWNKPLTIQFPDTPAKGKIKIEKSDKITGKKLSDVQFDIIAEEDIVTGDGTIRYYKNDTVDSVTTTEDGTAESEELYLGKYKVREVQQSLGYILSQKEYSVSLKYEGQEVPLVTGQLSVTNKPTEILIRKTDIKDNALSGVTFRIWSKEEGGFNQEFATDEKGEICIAYLVPGTYCIQEIKALEGYIQDDTIHEVQILQDGRSERTLELKNDYTKIQISKQDITSEEELPGARLKVLDENGGLVEEWISEKEPHMIERLAPGRYILHEEIAPKGYNTAMDIEFEVEETGEVHKVVMYDERAPLKDIKTGDSSSFGIYIACSVLSMILILLMLWKTLRNRRRTF